MAMHTDLPIHKVAFDLLSLATDVTRNIPRDFKAEEQQARFHMEAMALLEAAKPFVGRCNSIGGQQLSKTITEFIAKHRRKMP